MIHTTMLRTILFFALLVCVLPILSAKSANKKATPKKKSSLVSSNTKTSNTIKNSHTKAESLVIAFDEEISTSKDEKAKEALSFTTDSIQKQIDTIGAASPSDSLPLSILTDTLFYSVRRDSCDNEALYAQIAQWYGTPYRRGGCNKSGIDCSCFTSTLYREIYGINLKRSSSEMYKEILFVKKEELQEGDLVFFKTRKNRISHVGIYLKDGKFVHSSSSRGVMISDLKEGYWKRTYANGGRYKTPLEANNTSSSSVENVSENRKNL